MTVRHDIRGDRHLGSAPLAMTVFLFVALSPLRSLREMPAPVTEPTAAQSEMDGGLVEPSPLVTEPGPPAPADA